MAAVCRTCCRHLLFDDGCVCDRVLQLSGDPLPDAVRRRLLLGRLHHPVGRVSGQTGMAASATGATLGIANGWQIMDQELKQYLDEKFSAMDGKFAAMDGKFAMKADL